MFDSWRLAHFISRGEKHEVTASDGEVTQLYPITVKASEEGTAAISIKGGLGYVPVTFTNLPSYSGYSLLKKTESGWEKVDQSVHGNDYYQTWFDSETGRYEITFNVLHSGESDAIYEYKLVR